MSYNLKKLRLAGLRDFYEQSNNTDTLIIPIERYYNGNDLSNFQAYLLMEFSDGQKDKFMLNCNVLDEEILVSRRVGISMQRVAGTAKCQLSFENVDEIVTSDIFEIDVKPSIYDRTTDDNNPYIPTVINDLSEKFAQVKGTVQKNEENLALNTQALGNLESSLEEKITTNTQAISNLESSLTEADTALNEKITNMENTFSKQITANTQANAEHQTKLDNMKNQVITNNLQAVEGEALKLYSSEDVLVSINGKTRGYFASDCVELSAPTGSDNSTAVVFYGCETSTEIYGPSTGEICITQSGITIDTEGSVKLNGVNVVEEINTLKGKVSTLEGKITELETAIANLTNNNV